MSAMQSLYRVLRWRSGTVALRHLEKELKQCGYALKREKEYLYAAGDIPVLLVAHVDTVHKTPPAEIFYDAKARVLWSPQGLGADDRAGVWTILEVLRTGRRPHVLFTDGEEYGGIGAYAAAEELHCPEVHCAIELDRRGGSDAVYYGCGSEKLREWAALFGFREAHGTFSDISILCPEWDLAGANLSVGYVMEHSVAEHLYLDETERTIERVCRMLDSPPPERLAYEGGATHFGYRRGRGCSPTRDWAEGGKDWRDPYQDGFVEESLAVGAVCPQCLSDKVYEAYDDVYVCGACAHWWETASPPKPPPASSCR